ncbi:hypothetical protein EASAB2608_01034 [Streptomyces sp. EAS-AB2608]|uniref:hypothetical protein n=1 Tax=Streptomyces sp. EAS-AB2608 TaxID=2779671 RepID=UPI001BF15494|nr:hypothetical protein [Streptomyces sp. EAS-AB2608]BCM65700.1 hypothetical protein EASAB2608_01034 [Streptomyces sp. EAS-AB2608]
MRVHVTTTVGITAIALLVLPACSSHTSTSPAPSFSARSTSPAAPGPNATPLSSASLTERLLDAGDLGNGYTRQLERAEHNDDVTVLGCPALTDLGGDAATGGSLDFPRKAKTAFTYAGSSDSEVSEELYSDTPDKLSDGMRKIFDAMTGCPRYQVLVGGSAVDVATQKTAPPRLGDEQWSQLLTFSAGGHDSVMKQTAIRDGNVLVIVAGSPALVDRHLDKALAKAAPQ